MGNAGSAADLYKACQAGDVAKVNKMLEKDTKDPFDPLFGHYVGLHDVKK